MLFVHTGTTRLLYRMSMDFLGWARHVPGIINVWKSVAGQVRAFARVLLLLPHVGVCVRRACAGRALRTHQPAARDQPITPHHTPGAAPRASRVAQVLGEDLKLVLGQQDRLERGADTWANPVSYDKLGASWRWQRARHHTAFWCACHVSRPLSSSTTVSPQ
jgi:hypothetical protein